MIRRTTEAILICLIFITSGCANFGNEKFFESDAATSLARKNLEIDSKGMASVYLIHEKIPLQDISYIPLYPLPLAIDDKVVAAFPPGSFAHFYLEPGSHKFSFTNFVKNKLFSMNKQQELILEPNKIYFISKRLTPYLTNELNLLPSEEGMRYISKYPLAKVYHNPVPLDDYLINRPELKVTESSVVTSNHMENKESVNTGKLSNNQSALQLPSSSEVSDFFATVGAVALIAFILIGLSAGNGQPMYTPPAIDQVPYVSQSVPISKQTSVRSVSGRTMLLQDDTKLRSIYNLSTGVSYKIEGDRVIGSDGSRYRTVGSTIFSNSGSYYTKAGNTITSNDGRQCQMIGDLIDCN